jgi:NADPH:quinone reductase-like Zn-dependent oxidoreductase
MKAIIQNGYGSPDVFELKDIENPEVGEDGVLVRVKAAALHAGDYYTMRGEPYMVRFSAGWPKPKDYVPGFDAAGQVEVVGNNVTRFQPSDEIFGACSRTCAEYVCASEDKFDLKPGHLSFEEAAAVPTSAVTALRGLRDAGRVQPGQRVLVNGASGGVGTFAVQIAKALGAEVTGVCSTGNLELVRSLGADNVFDYTQQDFTKSGERYDLILDQVANHSFSDLRQALAPNGAYIPNSGNAGLGFVITAFIRSLYSNQQGRPFLATPNSDDLRVLNELIESGQIKPVIDKTYPLSETPQAFRYLDQGHACGKVVITV